MADESEGQVGMASFFLMIMKMAKSAFHISYLMSS